MKISMFHLMPYRDLPADFEDRYPSVWVNIPWSEVADAESVGRHYGWSLDELEYADEMGLDGVGISEHHQSAYGMTPSPNIMAGALARRTKNAALIVLGSSLPTTDPPQRIAEEYAMIDCLSGGRLVAGMPVGGAADLGFCYGVPPLEHRDRFHEAHDLIVQAWTRPEVFTFNGRYTQLRYVNIWPRPVQKPHPPIWIPGIGTASTWDFAAQHDRCYCLLSFWSKDLSKEVMDSYWERVDELGKDRNPYRAGIVQPVAVSESDARAEEEYFDHIRYFYDKCLHIPPYHMGAPGYLDYESLVRSTKSQLGLIPQMMAERKNWQFKDYVDNGFVIAGSPSSVADQLRDAASRLRFGNLMAMLHIGSMPHELTKKNIALFATEVMPQLRQVWDDEGWENHWWPEGLREPAGSAPAR